MALISLLKIKKLKTKITQEVKERIKKQRERLRKDLEIMKKKLRKQEER